MLKYFASRILFLLITSTTIGFIYTIWESNQLYNFFEIEFWSIFKIIISLVMLIIGSILLNLTFTSLYWKEILLRNFELKSDSINKRKEYFRSLIFDYKFSVIEFVYYYEKKREKYVAALCIITYFFVYPMIFKGIPFINNYSAVYCSLESTGARDIPITQEIPGIVVPKKDIEYAENYVAANYPDYVDEIDNKGYVFAEAALIDGFKSNESHIGIAEYFKCLGYSVLEKLTRVLVLFLLPFLLCIIITEVYFRKNKSQELWNNVSKVLINKNAILNDILEIIKKQKLEEDNNIQKVLIIFNNELFDSRTNIILKNKNWFQVQTILNDMEVFFKLIQLTENALKDKFWGIIKTNFENYTFDIHSKEKAKEYFDKIKKDKYYIDKSSLISIINLIPRNEIEINRDDFNKLEYLQKEWN